MKASDIYLTNGFHLNFHILLGKCKVNSLNKNRIKFVCKEIPLKKSGAADRKLHYLIKFIFFSQGRFKQFN